jgi:hypothetical protein
MDEDTLITTCDKLIRTLEQVPNLALRDVLQAQAELARELAVSAVERDNHEAAQCAYTIIEAIQVGLRTAGPFGITQGFSSN